MILVLIALLVVTSIVLLVIKRNTESFLVFGLCSSLLVFWLGTLTYIAKKGGISVELQLFLYLTAGIKTKLQYLMLTLGQLGYTVALGRYTFPLFLMRLALHYNMHPVIRKRRWLVYAAYVFPIASLIVYLPSVFETLTSQNLMAQRFLVQFTRGWITVYVLLAIGLLIHEYSKITIRFCKKQFLHKCVLVISLTMLYLLYYQQDPAQIYLFYRSDYMWLLGLWYLSPGLSLPSYITALIIALVSSVVGFASLIRYTQWNVQEDQNNMVLQRKFDAASTGASVFVHSVKNQLLANRVLYKRLDNASAGDQVDVEEIRSYVALLKSNNEAMIQHMETLYNSVKTKHIYLTLMDLGDIIDTALSRFYKKYPDCDIIQNVNRQTKVLADRNHMSEAVYNLLTNAWEATLEAEQNFPIEIYSHNERLYTVIEVTDHGKGIPKNKLNKVFEPFYSSKNSNYNWGMGLHYVRSIAKSHLGEVWVESSPGEGTSIFISLPRYDT